MNYGLFTFALSLFFTALLFHFADPMSWHFLQWIAFGMAAISINLAAGTLFKLFSSY